MSICNIAVRTILVLAFLFILTKVMGKKQISEASILDYTIGITIGSIAADISLDLEKNIIAGFISLLIYALVSIIASYLSLKSSKANKIINGSFIYLIKDKKIIINNLKKEGITILELQSNAREKGIFDLSLVKDAILETSGKINFNLNNDIPLNIIIDGEIIEDNLKLINKDINWLNKKLDTKKENILLMTISKDNKIKILEKEDDNEKL